MPTIAEMAELGLIDIRSHSDGHLRQRTRPPTDKPVPHVSWSDITVLEGELEQLEKLYEKIEAQYPGSTGADMVWRKKNAVAHKLRWSYARYTDEPGWGYW